MILRISLACKDYDSLFFFGVFWTFQHSKDEWFGVLSTDLWHVFTLDTPLANAQGFSCYTKKASIDGVCKWTQKQRSFLPFPMHVLRARSLCYSATKTM